MITFSHGKTKHFWCTSHIVVTEIFHILKQGGNFIPFSDDSDTPEIIFETSLYYVLKLFGTDNSYGIYFNIHIKNSYTIPNFLVFCFIAYIPNKII